MAAYPSFTQLSGSKATPRDDIETDFAVNGALQQRSYYTVLKRDFALKHLLNSTDIATNRSFYTTNRLLQCTFTFAGDGVTYNVRFKRPPREAWTEFGWQVEVELAEV
jgi:hypothetical protein